ncbi:proline racemase (plasmid) [Paracoccus versutus]|uniref:Proline racemase n=2 Tax=Paracoccus versutus TaxID=34007 RepID=A0AAQ0HKX4_PARVE|nr:proline racemase family protein [Paracoccus versutus]KGJ08336.1 proline racemase [Paracoccus versutus]REG54384.1 proline racemase [Paracoccus versutus]WEJ80845.1 proline racemase [Paracoccus versutus]
MSFEKSLDILLVHCQGESGNVLVGGAPEIPGATILDKMNHLNQVDPSLRLFLTREPRAQVVHTTNLLLAPTRPDADAGFIVLQPDRAHPMSGSNCICVVTALLETGRVKMVEPETVVRLDTAAGLILARARCENGRCLSVSLDNVPAFVQQLDAPVSTPQWGTIRADIAFGGVFYAQIDVDQVGLRIVPEAARALAEAGTEIKALLAEQVAVQHPEIPSLDEIAYVMFRDYRPDGSVVTCTTLKPGRVDRSPCGTGSSANLAVLHARGLARTGDRRLSRSIIGGTFTAEILGETTVGDRPAILPRITGQGYVFGRQQLRLDPQDPFAQGFALSDTWGPQVGEL